MNDPLRILANPPTTDTGIYVRAVEPSGKWRAADIAELEPESLADWLDGTPGRSRAVVLWLMGERDEARAEVDRLRAVIDDPGAMVSTWRPTRDQIVGIAHAQEVVITVPAGEIRDHLRGRLGVSS
jgi:hypothetical protein